MGEADATPTLPSSLGLSPSMLQSHVLLPIAYLREGGMTRSELMEAVAAISEQREFAPIDPYVARSDETLALEAPSRAQVLANQRPDELVAMLWKQEALSLAERRWESFSSCSRRGATWQGSKGNQEQFPKGKLCVVHWVNRCPENRFEEIASALSPRV